MEGHVDVVTSIPSSGFSSPTNLNGNNANVFRYVNRDNTSVPISNKKGIATTENLRSGNHMPSHRFIYEGFFSEFSRISGLKKGISLLYSSKISCQQLPRFKIPWVRKRNFTASMRFSCFTSGFINFSDLWVKALHSIRKGARFARDALCGAMLIAKGFSIDSSTQANARPGGNRPLILAYNTE